MRQIEKILLQIESCIINSTYQKLEHDNLDFKGNNHNSTQWKEVLKTACSFLNTGGEIIVIGIHEDEQRKAFKTTGFEKAKKTIINEFIEESKHKLNLGEYFTKFEIHEIPGKEILAIDVESLPED